MGSICDSINDFTTLMLEITDMSDNDSFFYTESLVDYSTKHKDKRFEKIKVGEMIVRIKGTITRTKGKKSFLVARVGKVNWMKRKSQLILVAHTSYATAHIGYTIIWRKSRSMS